MSSKHILPFTILFLFVKTLAPVYSQVSKADSLANLLKTDKEDTNKLNHLIFLSKELMFQNPDTAILLGEQALSLGTSIVGSSAAGKNKSIQKAAQKGVAKANGYLGIFYYLKGEYSISLKYHFVSLEQQTALQDKYGIANSCNNIGIVYRNQGDYPKALEYYFKSVKINIDLGNKIKIAQNLNNIGLIYNDQKDYPKALENYRKALSLHQELGNKVEVASTLNNIGIVYYEKGDYTKSLENYFKALKVNQEIENSTGIADNYTNIGTAYFKSKKYPEALDYFSKALDLNTELANKYGITMSMGNIGDIYIHEKKYAEAEKYLLDALKISTEIEALEFIKEQNELLSKLYAQTNRFQLAYEYNLAYTLAKDKLFNEDKSKEIGRLEMRHEIEKAEKERLDKIEAERKTALDQLNRRKNLQYSGIIVVLLIITVLVTVLGFVKVKQSVASGVVFFAFLIFFEFMMILLDPTVNRWSGGEPAYSLLLNAGIAACIFPIHAFFERIIKIRLIKKNAGAKS